ncbi:MAG: hypothetical protein E6767_01930 [Dysgonomonas sp.]|nr:hypothetical protein [Dysgonomonas sp.]
MDTKQPFCINLENNLIVAIFNNEIEELLDYAMDAGDPFWYIMGTDAWFELQEIGGKQTLVATTYDKTYFKCPVSEDILKILNSSEEKGILLINSEQPFTPQDILENLNPDSEEEAVSEWIEQQVEQGKNMTGLIFCYYTEEDKKRYHGD